MRMGTRNAALQRKQVEHRVEANQELSFWSSNLSSATNSHLGLNISEPRVINKNRIRPTSQGLVIIHAYYLQKQHYSRRPPFYKHGQRAFCVPGAVLGTRRCLDEVDKALL